MMNGSTSKIHSENPPNSLPKGAKSRLQEEVPSMGKPVLVLRNVTERPEGVEAGTLKLAGTEKEHIIKLVVELLDSVENYGKMAKATNPFGDGHASKRIVQAIVEFFGCSLG
jgi:UDP-N-acetylglucosamine 2-epimerase (non-hydrolysing)